MRFSFFATLACLGFGQASIYKKINDDWSFDVGKGQNADWMNLIDGSRSLSSLVIPGTHNSATDSLADTLTSKLMQTQNVPLQDQLTGGIRYIDITCKVSQNELVVYNGVSKTKSSFGLVLSTIFNFLDQHQTETVILRIQMGTSIRGSKSAAETFEQYFTSGSGFAQRIADHVYTNGGNGITTIPTLNELRGKIFILEDFKAISPGRYGLPWNENTVSSYSRTFSASTTFMDSKWDDIKSHLSETPRNSANKLRITHTTASVGVSPIKFAARNAPKVGMNKHLGKYLRDERGVAHGIVAMDFPGQYLVKQILLLNGDYWAAQAATQPPDNRGMSSSADALGSV
ncbi:1-phosphatidylinositol phosphodiesterase [Ceratocystis platani]|uniref:1-phosphatidylinositol phosphodiesterase n=1 Tax=Ceratocystis fimbriata f. sp. platani TaxID=88771 RepID=A0A0F8AWB8_CERFI|nr:1-phosphatidylinositol phosphodiesterase [Ceratocystis platani]